jgi:hypothetical protein
MTIPRETLMAYVDGELSGAEEARVTAALARDPALNAYVEQQRALKQTLQSEFAPILSDRLPQSLEDAVLRARTLQAQGRRRRGSWLTPRALTQFLVPAATMAAGFALGLVLIQPREDSPVAAEGGRFLARGALAQALSTQLASEQGAAAQAVRVGLTFRDANGTVCRSFVDERDASAFAGIACREGAAWRIAMLAPAAASGSGYTQAAAAMPALLRETIGALMRGAPLDAEQERAARAAGWR